MCLFVSESDEVFGTLRMYYGAAACCNIRVHGRNVVRLAAFWHTVPPWVAGEYLQIPIFEYRSIYRLVPRSVQCCQLPCYHGRDPLPTCMVLASNQVVRTRALVHAQTWSPMGEVPSALCWSSGTPPPAAGGGGRF